VKEHILMPTDEEGSKKNETEAIGPKTSTRIVKEKKVKALQSKDSGNKKNFGTIC